MTKSAKLKAFLSAGNEVTAKQVKSMFKIANPTATIAQLRREGVCIYGNEATLSTGEKVTKYRIGTPSRAMVALAAAAGYFA